MQSVTIFEVCYNIPTEQKLFELKVVTDIHLTHYQDNYTKWSESSRVHYA